MSCSACRAFSKTGASSSSPPQTSGSHSPGMIRSGHTRIPARKPSSSLTSIASLSIGKLASFFSSSFRRRGLLCMRPPVPGQQVTDTVDRMIRNPGQNVTQPSLRIKAIQFCGLDQRQDGRSPFSACIRPCKEPVLPSESNRADGTLGGIVVDLDRTVIEIAAQGGPARQSIADGLRSGALSRQARELPLQPLPQRLDLRPRLLL